MGRPVCGIGPLIFGVMLLIAPCTAQAQALDHYTLMMAWLPGQCLVNPDRPLCDGLTLKDPAGRNLTLIGLRPDAHVNSVPLRDCDPLAEAFSTPTFSGDAEVAADCHLPAMKLSDELAKSLAEIMPATKLCEERRFWSQHGSCSMLSQERYFRRAVDRANEMQHTLLNFAIAGGIGTRVQYQTLVDAFTRQFGEGSAPSLQILCGRSKIRRVPVLTEIRLQLLQQGTMQPLSESGLWRETNALRQRCPDNFLIAEAGQPVPDPTPPPAPPGTLTVPPMPDAPVLMPPVITVPEMPAAPADPTKPQPMQTEPVEIIPATP